MANRTFTKRQTLEKNITDLVFKFTEAPTASTATLATTTPIVLSKVATGSVTNGYTFTSEVLAAAANPTLTVLAAVTGNAGAVVCTITPNDGTNNPTVQAFGSLDLTTDIVLTKTAAAQAGVLGNGSTFTLEVEAAAANPTDKVLAVITGDAADIVCTITPNDGTNNPTTQASASIATATPIVLTKTVAAKPGVLGNTNTFTIQVEAAAANPTDKILVGITGTAAAIICTITPNDGTNNAATPVNFTSAELVTLINAGTLVNVNLTDLGTLLNDQTATGGGAVAFADAGEGDGLVGTFAGGANTAVSITTANLVTLINSGTLTNVNLTNTGGLLNDQTATGGGSAPLANSGEGDGKVCTFGGGVNTPVSLTTAELAELITSGSVVGKTVSVTDTGTLLNDQTATGGGAEVLVNLGEGDSKVATFAGAVDFTFQKKYGISGITYNTTGVLRIILEDRYNELIDVHATIKDATARDIHFQIKAESVNAAIPYVDLMCVTTASAANLASGSEVWGTITLKNGTAV